MPIIALPRPQAVTALPGLALDRESRGQVDTRGVQSALLQFNESNKLPQMDPQAMAAPYEALGSVGRAIAQAGSVLGGIALKKQEAENDIAIARADQRMDREYADFEAWKADRNNDPQSWAPEWERRLATLQKEFGSMEKLHPAARENINLRLIRYSGQSAAGVAKDATKQTFALAKSYTLSDMEEGIRTQDRGRYETARQTGLTKGYIFPHEATYSDERYNDVARTDLDSGISAALDDIDRGRGIAKAKQLLTNSGDLLRPEERTAKLARIDAVHTTNLEKDQIQERILTDPKKAIADLEGDSAFPHVTGGDRAAFAVQAKQAQAAMASDAFRDVKTRIELGQVKADETFTGPGMEQLTPLMVDVLKAMNTDKTRLASMNNPEAFQKAATAIDSYAPTEGDDLARANFEAYLESAFSGPHLESLKKQWDARMQTGADKVGTAEAFSALDRWAFDEQQMGQFKVPETDKDGRQLLKKSMSYVTQPGWLWGENQVESETYSPQWKDDPVKRNKVSQEVGRIKDLIRAEIKAGKLTDSAAVFRRMAELSKMPMATSAAAEAATAVEGGPSVVPPLNRPPPEDLDQKRQEALKLINPSATR